MNHINQITLYEKKFSPHISAINYKSVIKFQLSSFCSSLVAMTTIKILSLYFQCEKFHKFIVLDNGDMADCFFFIMKLSRMTSRILLFSIFYADTEEMFFFSEIWTLEFHICGTAWWILVIHIYHSSAFLKLFQIKATCIFVAVPLWIVRPRLSKFEKNGVRYPSSEINTKVFTSQISDHFGWSILHRAV